MIPARDDDFFFACFSLRRAWYLVTESFSVEPPEAAVLAGTAEVVVPSAEAAGEACASAGADRGSPVADSGVDGEDTHVVEGGRCLGTLVSPRVTYD
ncbi:hypothetical protein P3T76_010021 [Phytophthora citrophthora]|uniref:Uncharacterized protein n=1 Tax=Phytophthora citrophthora TaxID=4793 RepID=A0AAD9GEC8_9STRA|nr:hypothetical protein P3T76_010021 [Phytophthora citrophthora]